MHIIQFLFLKEGTLQNTQGPFLIYYYKIEKENRLSQADSLQKTNLNFYDKKIIY